MALTSPFAELEPYSFVQMGFWWWLVDLAIVGVAYVFQLPGIYGKGTSGRLPVWSWFVYFPWHVFTRAVWYLDRRWDSQPGLQWVHETLAVGRRPMAGEVPGDFDHFVDLTAEFSEVRYYRQFPGYVCFPILDGTAPRPGSLLEAVRSVRFGKTFVHCAKGHGRTGLFAIAILLESGQVASPEEGLKLLQTVRPGVRLNRAQRNCLEQFLHLTSSRQPANQF